VEQFKDSGDFDDRVLYWSRLEMSKLVKLSPVYASLLPTQQQDILWKLELLTRGQQDIKFDKGTNKKILVTGFDPFFLDRNIDQSNPSGVAALALDDLVINFEGKSAEIETLIVPVRFADFDQGMIEALLSPYYDQVDMIVTISMGRENFDLERFPGLRRSAKAPDNANIYTGADQKTPLVPQLNGKPLTSPEFVEFSLPVAAMQKAVGHYKINDNKNITTLTGNRTANNLAELATETSVQGSGGGYLSNEISYRSIVLRNKLNVNLPVGHIHTPRIKAFEPETSKKVVEQIKQMLSFALTEI
jgi:pyrrolidone-carboxylate peptidase